MSPDRDEVPLATQVTDVAPGMGVGKGAWRALTALTQVVENLRQICLARRRHNRESSGSTL